MVFQRAARGLAALLAAVILPNVQAAPQIEVWPYFQAWGGDSLLEGRRSAGLDGAILAFAVTQGWCALDPRFMARLAEAGRYTAEGGKLTISFGGAEGTYAEAACSDEQLHALIETVMARVGTRRLDWDLEGRHLAQPEAHARRNRVLVRLQQQHPDLHVTYTLTGRSDGLGPESLRVLRTALQDGVRIDRVNVMTMSFGSRSLQRFSPPTLSRAAMASFHAAADQIAPLFPGLSRSQLHARMGITPMIGANDDDTTFTLQDARHIAEFAASLGIGLIAYWSWQRDRRQEAPGYQPLGAWSGIAQSSREFLRIFKQARLPACAQPAWVPGRPYAEGALVRHAGLVFRAYHANPGYDPTVSTYYWSRLECRQDPAAPSAPGGS